MFSSGRKKEKKQQITADYTQHIRSNMDSSTKKAGATSVRIIVILLITTSLISDMHQQ